MFMVVPFQRNTYLTAAITLFIAIVLLFGGVVHAIARGYTTNDEGLSAGMVAALSESGDSEVERADQTSSKRIVGVVTTFDNSSVTLASGSSKVLVESEGEVMAYVSDIGGEIEKGDLLALSSFKGILMKSSSGSGAIIGVASESSSSVPEENVTKYAYTEDGADKTTRIVKVRVNLNKQAVTAGVQSDPSALSKIGASITGKQVSDIRVLAALVIFMLVMVAEGGIIYGAVTSAITAMGRNPLARKMIRREMTRVIVIAIGVLGIGLGAVYGILWY